MTVKPDASGPGDGFHERPAPTHPTDQILHAYGLGKLGDPAASAVDSHLEGCEACRRRVSELRATASWAGSAMPGLGRTLRPRLAAIRGPQRPRVPSNPLRSRLPTQPWPARFPRSWPTTRNTRSSASWAAAAWASSTWRATR